MVTKTIKDHINDILLKINNVDHQIIELEKTSSRHDNKIENLHNKLDQFREDIRSCRNIPELKDKIVSIESDLDKIKTDLQAEINILKLEMPEMRLIKKVVLGMIAFILTAFLGIIWNGLITTNKKADSIDEFAKKIAEEYKKNGPPK